MVFGATRTVASSASRRNTQLRSAVGGDRPGRVLAQRFDQVERASTGAVSTEHSDG